MNGESADDDGVLVSRAMEQLAAARGARSWLDPEWLWRRAQIVRRLEAERLAGAPLEQSAQVVAGLACFCAAAVGAWFWYGQPWTLAGVAAVLTLIIAGFAALHLAWRWNAH